MTSVQGSAVMHAERLKDYIIAIPDELAADCSGAGYGYHDDLF